MRPYIFAFIARVINTLTERAAMNVFNVAKVMVCLLRGKSHTLILATIGAKYTYTNTTGEVLAIVGVYCRAMIILIVGVRYYWGARKYHFCIDRIKIVSEV